MNIQEILSYAFIQRALIAGGFISIVCAVLGVFLVLRRFSLIGDGLAHVTFGSIALGLLLGIYPVYVSVPVVALSSLGILKLTEKEKVFGDAAIGIVSSVGIAGGIIMASISGGFNVDLFSYLFGNILVISWAEVVFSMFLSIVVILLVLIFYYELFSLTFDEEYATVSGIKTKWMNRILVILTSISVVLAMRIVGTMLISSMLILPVVTALQFAGSFRKTIICSSVFALASVFLGILISFVFDLPSGATIVMLNFIFFCIALIWKKLV